MDRGGRGEQTCGKDYLADILTILISHGRRDATMIVKCFKGLVVALNHTSLRVGVWGGDPIYYCTALSFCSGVSLGGSDESWSGRSACNVLSPFATFPQPLIGRSF